MPPLLPTAIITALCAASAVVLSVQLRRRSRTPSGDSPPAPVPHVPAGAILFAMFWIVYHVANDITAMLADMPAPSFDPERTLTALQQNCFVFATGAVVLWTLLTRGDVAQFRAFGAVTERIGVHLRYGVATVTAAWLPVFVVLWLTMPLRTPDRQHAVLQLLGARPSFEIYAWAVLSAVIVAPLSEELVFRVILQTWLERHVGKAAVPTAAVLFAVVHRFPDSLAIVPLALVLGDAFLRRRSYWEVVAAHGLFNAVMLALDAVSPHG
jgi:membrane protease YdiL (CAAX protease family)